MGGPPTGTPAQPPATILSTCWHVFRCKFRPSACIFFFVVKNGLRIVSNILHSREEHQAPPSLHLPDSQLPRSHWFATHLSFPFPVVKPSQCFPVTVALCFLVGVLPVGGLPVGALPRAVRACSPSPESRAWHHCSQCRQLGARELQLSRVSAPSQSG